MLFPDRCSPLLPDIFVRDGEEKNWIRTKVRRLERIEAVPPRSAFLKRRSKKVEETRESRRERPRVRARLRECPLPKRFEGIPNRNAFFKRRSKKVEETRESRRERPRVRARLRECRCRRDLKAFLTETLF